MNSNTFMPNKLTSIAGHRALFLLPALLFLSVTPARATTLLNPVPENSTTLFGLSVTAVGDVNGDGVNDLAVGEPFADGTFDGAMGFGPPQNVGRIFLISGADFSVIRTLEDPDYQLATLDKFASQLGTSVAAAGDLNGDGVPDILAGLPHYTLKNLVTKIEFISTGKAYVFSGKDGTVLLTLKVPSDEENARAGYSVAGLGDINADGKPDFLVGSPGKNIGVGEGGKTDVGVAYFYSGADGSIIRTVSDPDSTLDARFGFAVANAGDVDGDGVSDAIIGAPGKAQAFVFSGKTGSLLFTIASPVREKTNSFGTAVAGGKDFDGDGKPDFVVGAPLFKNSQGGAFIFRGSDKKLLRRLSLNSPQNFARFGASVAAVGDMTGDGIPDVMAGVPDQDVSGAINAGQAVIFNGSTGAIFKTLSSETIQATAGFGSAVGAVDFTGNGTFTPIIGVPYQTATLVAPDGDLDTHLQIGQIEIR
ncbi:MAG: integrin alpha [Chthoniobacterales bacterium]